MKTVLIYCGEDGEAGKALAVSIRREGKRALLCSASDFHGPEDCDEAIVANDVPEWRASKIDAAYGNEKHLSRETEANEIAFVEAVVRAVPPRRRGRPPGSKNKTKAALS